MGKTNRANIPIRTNYRKSNHFDWNVSLWIFPAEGTSITRFDWLEYCGKKFQRWFVLPSEIDLQGRLKLSRESCDRSKLIDHCQRKSFDQRCSLNCFSAYFLDWIPFLRWYENLSTPLITLFMLFLLTWVDWLALSERKTLHHFCMRENSLMKVFLGRNWDAINSRCCRMKKFFISRVTLINQERKSSRKHFWNLKRAI